MAGRAVLLALGLRRARHRGLVWPIAWLLLGAEGKLDQAATTAAPSLAASFRPARIPYRRLLFNSTVLAAYFAAFAQYWAVSVSLAWGTPFLVNALGYSQAAAGTHGEWIFRGADGTSSASDLRRAWGAFHVDKAGLELEIGFGDFEHPAASLFAFSATFEICRDDTICGKARQIRGSAQSHCARVLEVRIHLPPAESRVRTRHLYEVPWLGGSHRVPLLLIAMGIAGPT